MDEDFKVIKRFAQETKCGLIISGTIQLNTQEFELIDFEVQKYFSIY